MGFFGMEWLTDMEHFVMESKKQQYSRMLQVLRRYLRACAMVQEEPEDAVKTTIKYLSGHCFNSKGEQWLSTLICEQNSSGSKYDLALRILKEQRDNKVLVVTTVQETARRICAELKRVVQCGVLELDCRCDQLFLDQNDLFKNNTHIFTCSQEVVDRSAVKIGGDPLLVFDRIYLMNTSMSGSRCVPFYQPIMASVTNAPKNPQNRHYFYEHGNVSHYYDRLDHVMSNLVFEFSTPPAPQDQQQVSIKREHSPSRESTRKRRRLNKKPASPDEDNLENPTNPAPNANNQIKVKKEPKNKKANQKKSFKDRINKQNPVSSVSEICQKIFKTPMQIINEEVSNTKPHEFKATINIREGKKIVFTKTASAANKKEARTIASMELLQDMEDAGLFTDPRLVNN
ncbi:hypothetical protein AKO1_013379 [Acrasis kona]|uniref:DRBM domain-containing protein n=1 Tax=Acrasis kona TaxID=1008807 RepID=A0AAW2YYG4_9EUKA